jgi:hypothetical protein
MRYVVWGLLVALVVLHQSGIASDSNQLVFGFLPINLLFHAAISCAAGAAWFLAVKFAWPAGLDDEPVSDSDAASNGDAA